MVKMISKIELLKQHIKLRKIYQERSKKFNDKFSRDLAESQTLAINKLRKENENKVPKDWKDKNRFKIKKNK